MVSIVCPSCGQKLSAPDNAAGQNGKCPKCGKAFLLASLKPENDAEEIAANFLLKDHLPTASPNSFDNRSEGAFSRPASTPARSTAVSPKRSPRPLPPRKSGKLWYALTALCIVCLLGVVAFLVRSSKQSPQETSPRKIDEGGELLAKMEQERQRLEQERIAIEKERASLEDKQKREEEGRLAQLERDRVADELRKQKEDERAQDQRTWLTERKNPKTASLEEVNNYPDRYYGKVVYFDNVKISGSDIEKKKELNRFTLGIESARGKYFSGIIVDHLFFTTNDRIANALLASLRNDEQFFHVKLFCEIRKNEADDSHAIPEAYVYRIEVFNRAGERGRTIEE
jgi:hypothetical protein